MVGDPPKESQGHQESAVVPQETYVNTSLFSVTLDKGPEVTDVHI